MDRCKNRSDPLDIGPVSGLDCDFEQSGPVDLYPVDLGKPVDNPIDLGNLVDGLLRIDYSRHCSRRAYVVLRHS